MSNESKIRVGKGGDGNWLREAFLGLAGGGMWNDYAERKVAKKLLPKDNLGLGVSSCWTPDFGYETAILDAKGAHPVERYNTKTECLKGHRKWIKFTKNPRNKEIIKLGDGGIIKDRRVVLKICQ